MLWEQRFEGSMVLRLLVRHGISARKPRGKVILAIARNRYKERARRKGIAAGAAARFAIDEVLRAIDRMERRERPAPESGPRLEPERETAVETGCEANVA